MFSYRNDRLETEAKESMGPNRNKSRTTWQTWQISCDWAPFPFNTEVRQTCSGRENQCLPYARFLGWIPSAS